MCSLKAAIVQCLSVWVRLLLQTFVKWSSMFCSHVLWWDTMCSKSRLTFSLLLNFPQSTVWGTVMKWKRLGTEMTPHKNIGLVKSQSRVIGYWWGHQRSAKTRITDLEISCSLQINSRTMQRDFNKMVSPLFKSFSFIPHFGWPCPAPATPHTTAHSKVHKDMDASVVKEHDWPAQNPDLNLT